MSVGWPQLLIVLLIVLVIFGAKRLPEIGRSLGGGMREFKDSVTGRDDDTNDVVDEPQITRTSETDKPS
jgi:sec-independent protein translocase protein TatA